MLQAAEQGHAQAEYDAGVMLMQGDGDGGPDIVRGEVRADTHWIRWWACMR